MSFKIKIKSNVKLNITIDNLLTRQPSALLLCGYFNVINLAKFKGPRVVMHTLLVIKLPQFGYQIWFLLNFMLAKYVILHKQNVVNKQKRPETKHFQGHCTAFQNVPRYKYNYYTRSTSCILAA